MKRLALALLCIAASRGQALLDLAYFARPCCVADRHTAATSFDYGLPGPLMARPDMSWVYGLQWAEERDIEEHSAGSLTTGPSPGQGR